MLLQPPLHARACDREQSSTSAHHSALHSKALLVIVCFLLCSTGTPIHFRYNSLSFAVRLLYAFNPNTILILLLLPQFFFFLISFEKLSLLFSLSQKNAHTHRHHITHTNGARETNRDACTHIFCLFVHLRLSNRIWNAFICTVFSSTLIDTFRIGWWMSMCLRARVCSLNCAHLCFELQGRRV